MGNGEAKELICTTHGHELRGGMLVGGVQGKGRIKDRKKWDNCNSISILNKRKEVLIYILQHKQTLKTW